MKPLRWDFPDRLSVVFTRYGKPFPPHAHAEIMRVHDRMRLVCEQIAIVERERNALVEMGRATDVETVEAKVACPDAVAGHWRERCCAAGH